MMLVIQTYSAASAISILPSGERAHRPRVVAQ
jgi:hypothetical protein